NGNNDDDEDAVAAVAVDAADAGRTPCAPYASRLRYPATLASSSNRSYTVRCVEFRYGDDEDDEDEEDGRGYVYGYASKEHIAVTTFRDYLRIKTVQPNPDYAGCKAFLQRLAEELGLKFSAVEAAKGKCPHVWCTLHVAHPYLDLGGEQPVLPTLILNSHTDVVPVSEDKWTHDPFAADKLPNGDIIARGSQDMKCVGIQYLEAIRILKAQGKQPVRTVHVTFVPDEEIGGSDGMAGFRKMKEFKDLNAGFPLDEGIANPGNACKAFYGERYHWWLKVTARGMAGHGSQFLEPCATVRLHKIIKKFLAFREAEKARLEYGRKESGVKFTLGDVKSTNLTMLQAGKQINVVPEEASAFFDMRVSPTVDLQKLKKEVEGWCSDDGVELTFLDAGWSNAITPIDDSNPWWKALTGAAKRRNVELEP
ncbi:adenylate cyclase, partial [Borealophlyctis nickersoniae]